MANAGGSYHHAAGLNKALERVATRYVLFLDPDFFIIRPNWIEDVLEHMDTRGLSFWGAPYHPARSIKYRYFPGPACMLVDLKRAARSELDFRPEIEELAAVRSLGWRRLAAWGLAGRHPNQPSLPADATSKMARDALRAQVKARILRRFPGLLIVGSSRDTGHRIYRSFGNGRGHASETLVASWVNPLYSPPTSPGEARKQRLMRWLVPEAWSPYPKRRDYSTLQTFRDFGLPDVANLGWEEYFWRGEPFAFHIQGFARKLSQTKRDQLSLIIEEFVEAPSGLLSSLLSDADT